MLVQGTSDIVQPPSETDTSVVSVSEDDFTLCRRFVGECTCLLTF